VDKQYDVCIVGSGAGASPIAYELANSGYDVIMIEKGRYYDESTFSKDELAVSRRDMFTPKLSDEQHVIIDANDGNKRYLGSEYSWSFWNGSLVGGSSNLMSGYFHRMKPKDFKLLSTYGKIEDANLVDWVVGYDELEAYYDKVEKVIGVSGEVQRHKFYEPRSSKDFPYTPLKENKVTKWFDKACKELGFKPLKTPRAILSQDALGRSSCYYSNFCGSYGCSSGAKGSARAALLQKADKKHLSIITEAFVYKLNSDKKRVTKAYYYDKAKKSHFIKAKIFVVAAQAIESARLLLNSKNSYFPNGLANNSNQVGKNLIFSAGGTGSGRFYTNKLSHKQKEELFERGVFFNRYLLDWYEYRDKKPIKGGLIDFLFEHSNIISRASRELYDENGNILWGKKLQDKLHYKLTKSRVLTFEVFNDWLPTDKCFVSVDKKVKDKYGMPVGLISIYSHKRDLEVGEFLSKKAVEVLKKMGAVEVSYSVGTSPPPNLVAGGCRFGDDPKTSVLDKNCKAWELDNLYVTDASFMPTGGSVPYTWTIYANSFRVADELKKVLRKLS